MISYLQVENITKRYGEVLLFEDISFGINQYQKIALVAKNGTGKTSLLEIIAGRDTPDTGSISKRTDLTIGYLEQEPDFVDSHTVLEHVFLSSNRIVNAVYAYRNAIESEDKDRLQKAMEQMDALHAWDFDVRIKQILSRLSIENHNQKISKLSGGQKKRIALANVLINEPDLLILDEPTNHLDLEMIEWLEQFLKKSKCTLLMVTHDRYFLDRVCNEIIELDDKTLYRYRGNYSYFLEKREMRIQNRNAYVEKTKELLKKELDWIKRSPMARTSKSKSRIDKYEKTKQEISSLNVQDEMSDINIKTTRLGKKILDLYNLNKSFEDLKILDDFTYRFKRFEKIGIVGKNGSGKTTLLNIITGNEPVDSGKIDMGETVSLGYYKQSGMKLQNDKRVIEVIRDVAEVITLGDKKFHKGKKLTAAQFLEYFLFPPEMHYQYVSSLSGGERRRLYMMTILMKNPNFLILDEPTNDLDIMTLNVLEEYLVNFDGCVLVVSHDRYFMDKVIDTVLVFEGEGKVKNFPGTYTEYRRQKDAKEKLLKQNQKQAKEPEKKTKTTAKTTKKFSYKQKYELEQVEKEIQHLEAEKSRLEEMVNSGTLSHDELADKAQQLTTTVNMLDEKEMRWLELSDLMDA